MTIEEIRNYRHKITTSAFRDRVELIDCARARVARQGRSRLTQDRLRTIQKQKCKKDLDIVWNDFIILYAYVLIRQILIMGPDGSDATVEGDTAG